MNKEESIQILEAMQRWRRGEDDDKYDEFTPTPIPYTPEEYGKALDFAIATLRMEDSEKTLDPFHKLPEKQFRYIWTNVEHTFREVSRGNYGWEVLKYTQARLEGMTSFLSHYFGNCYAVNDQYNQVCKKVMDVNFMTDRAEIWKQEMPKLREVFEQYLLSVETREKMHKEKSK